MADITSSQAYAEWQAEMAAKVKVGASPYAPTVAQDSTTQFNEWLANKYPTLAKEEIGSITPIYESTSSSTILSTRNILIGSSVLVIGIGIFVYFKFFRKKK